jgi:hypothetical protein
MPDTKEDQFPQRADVTDSGSEATNSGSQQLFTLRNSYLHCTVNATYACFTELSMCQGDTTIPLVVTDASVQPLFRLRWSKATQEPQTQPAYISHIGSEDQLELQHVDYRPRPEGAQHLKLSYLLTGESETYGAHQALVSLQIVLGANANALQMTLEVTNKSVADTIYETIFPILSNLRVEPQPEDESLLYPFFSGTKLNSPREVIWAAKRQADLAAPLGPVFSDAGAVIRHLYSGRLSMPWFTVTGRQHGVALVHMDSKFDVTALAVYAPSLTPVESGSDGEKEPSAATCLHLSVSKLKPVGPGECYALAPTEIIAYIGSWHQIADRYRTWAQQLMLPPRVPRWVRESHALTAHYDFKWQDGTFTHTFADIPELYRRTAKEGIDHLFMAGWFTGGFDHMYPEFFPDLQLGTVMDFIEAVRTVRSTGGKSTFYINASLFGKASHYHPTLGMDWAVKGPDGEPIERKFFDGHFTINCRGVHAYQRHMRDTVRWLVGEVGAQGVYLDTFAAIGPHLCFDTTHSHPHPAHWNRDAIATLRLVEDGIRQSNPDAFTMFEGCSDIYGQWIVAHLIHGWYYLHSYPELFHYTFPEYVLVDMVYPTKGQSFRPQRISDNAYQQLHRTWGLGCILWTYDQEDQRFCNFRTDPEMWQYIKQLIRLREAGKSFFAYGVFMDTLGLVNQGETQVKRFSHTSDQIIAANALDTETTQESVQPTMGFEEEPPTLDQLQQVAIEMLTVWSNDNHVAEFTMEPWLIEQWYMRLGHSPRLTACTVNGTRQNIPVTQVAGRFVVQPAQAQAQIIFVW